MLSGVEWSGVGDTPQTVMTTRAPAVLKNMPQSKLKKIIIGIKYITDKNDVTQFIIASSKKALLHLDLE